MTFLCNTQFFHAIAKCTDLYLYDPEKAESLAASIRHNNGVASIFKADVSQEDQVKDMFKAAIMEWGSLDILVNNVGLQQDTALVDMSLEQWNKVINVNLTMRKGSRQGISAARFSAGIIPRGRENHLHVISA